MIQQNPFIDWLLDSKIPTIRYQTLVNLLGLPTDNDLVNTTRQEIMQIGPVPAILAKQTAAGHWANEHSYYTPKYVSTHWSLMLLTELDIDGRNPQFAQGVEYMLETTANNLKEDLEANKTGFSCFWGNLLRYASHAGLQTDERFADLVTYAIQDISSSHCQCAYNWHFACAWGVIRTLWGLSAIPESKRSQALAEAINIGVTFLLDTHQLIEANYPTSSEGKVHPLWFKLNFPLFYQTDILFTLRIMAELNKLNHPGVQPVLDWLESRRGKNGRWRGSSPYRQRTWAEVGSPAETNRWVSLQAAAILMKAHRLNI